MPFTEGRPLTEAEAALFKALAHPARVRVLELLASGEHTMGELAALSGFEPSHLSQHVSTLRRAGLVDGRRVGTTVVCTLRDARTAELLGLARRLIAANLRHDRPLQEALDTADDAVAAADRVAGPDRRGGP